MMRLLETLAVLEKSLQHLGRTHVLAQLRPGLDAREIRKHFDALGLPDDADLVELYAWRDGTNTDRGTLGDIQLFPGFYMLCLDDAIANYRAFAPDPRWNPTWFPVFANGGGDFYAIDLAAGRRFVLHYMIEETEHPVEFTSLRAMLATLAAAFAEEVFYVDPQGYLEMDDFAFIELAARLNPDVPWWNE